MNSTFSAALLGLLEGLTEFVPVSSTGHLLLAGHFLGFDSPEKTFEIVIQLGAVLALFSVYAARLLQIVSSIPENPEALRFIASVMLAFFPAVVVGIIAHDFIKTILFESPTLIASMLIIGGIILLFVDRLAPTPLHMDAMQIPIGKSLLIGFVQCLAMIPGVSRSGATIVGALMLGVSKRAAAEFSFFLSLPTMMGAFAYEVGSNHDVLDFSAWWNIAIGASAAFVTALFVVRWVLEYVSHKGFALFGWWRIIVGSLALAGIYAFD